MERRRKEVLCPLRERALETPKAPAIVGAEPMNYTELDTRVTAVARYLRELGCEVGTRVALYLPTDERYVVLLLALLRIGAVACPLSTRLPPQSVSSLVERIGGPFLISGEERLAGALDPDALDIISESPVAVEKEPSDRLRLPLDRAATIIFTSGSSGRPKAALHTFGNHYYSALGSGANIPLSGEDRWLLSLPLYHVGGLSILFRCLLSGAKIAIPEPGVPLGGSIPALGATHVSLVATQLRRLLEERANIGCLKTILLGGGPVPNTLVDEAVSRNLPVHTSYGLTEMSSQVTTTPPGATPATLRTAGRILPHRRVSISEDGEILVGGDTLFAGYVEGGEVKRSTDEAGWFHTRDLGELDRKGYLRVRGRRDNLFVSGGENIQPEEIEEALERLDGVERAVVVPVPNAEFGERPVAFVLAADDNATPDALSGMLEESLPRFKVPAAFYDWPEDADPGKTKVDRPLFRARALRMQSPGGKCT